MTFISWPLDCTEEYNEELRRTSKNGGCDPYYTHVTLEPEEGQQYSPSSVYIRRCGGYAHASAECEPTSDGIKIIRVPVTVLSSSGSPVLSQETCFSVKVPEHVACEYVHIVIWIVIFCFIKTVASTVIRQEIFTSKWLPICNKNDLIIMTVIFQRKRRLYFYIDYSNSGLSARKDRKTAALGDISTTILANACARMGKIREMNARVCGRSTMRPANANAKPRNVLVIPSGTVLHASKYLH